MPWVNGQILTEDGFREGSIGFDEDEILDISSQKNSDPLAEGIVLPLFVNPHTHIGDSFIKADLKGSIEEIVAPPDGLKHRLLEQATDDEVVEGMRETLDLMEHSGISHFLDFREGGVKGASLLYKAALEFPLTPIAYGRPAGMEYDSEEMEALLKIVDGIGISSMMDWDSSNLEKIREHVGTYGKGFALHASERVREDIDAVLELDPDFIVHMLEATESDLERCSDAGVPIVVCPRSNAHYGKSPNLAAMTASGVEIMLGTDNAMFSSPSLFDEMRFVRQSSNESEGLTSGSVLRMALNSRKLLKGQSVLTLGIGQPSEFLVLDWRGENPEKFIVERASERDISVIARGRRLWTRNKGDLKEESDWLERE
jgi:cytosine/adenosine deaminase-related metal-dependent hydrolase